MPGVGLPFIFPFFLFPPPVIHAASRFNKSQVLMGVSCLPFFYAFFLYSEPNPVEESHFRVVVFLLRRTSLGGVKGRGCSSWIAMMDPRERPWRRKGAGRRRAETNEE
ncbi:hypothetical protein LX32DRAFT_111920 [Colletotrichum zoysiae]|uniref:Secreted protein n=1 Tax=Colletotrichum zoysiae TaxID=1216348 RepID=A0AAD9H8J3_9PEZI|nr:hypothetical protein LX32DRAFT_111920 [Colletotrichum zoysiae]